MFFLPNSVVHNVREAQMTMRESGHINLRTAASIARLQPTSRYFRFRLCMPTTYRKTYAVCIVFSSSLITICTLSTRIMHKFHCMPKCHNSTTTLYRVAQKLAPFLYALTLPNINRFSKLFHCQNQEKVCNNAIAKDPPTPHVCRYTTL